MIAVHLVILVNPLDKVILVLTQPQLLAKERKYLNGRKYLHGRMYILKRLYLGSHKYILVVEFGGCNF